MAKKILHIIIFLFITINTFSQNYNIKNYTVNDGLLHSFINDILQDKRGNIWIATGGGLCEFNGVEFKNYTTKDGLNYPRLLSIAQDNLNNIWIGSLAGLNVFNGDSIYSINKDEDEKIYAIEKSNDGKMWIFSNKGVKKIEFKNGKFNFEKVPFDFGVAKDINIFQETKWNKFLIETANKRLFIGLNNKVYKYFNKKIFNIDIPDSLQIFSACESDNNKIIFGTNHGLYTYNDTVLNKIPNLNIDKFNIYKIRKKDNNLWMIGSKREKSSKELYLLNIKLNNNNFYRIISVSNGLINNPTSLFIDHENNIWTCSSGGLNVLKGESFVNYSTKNGLIGNKIWGIYKDQKQRIWVGTINEGLSIILKDTILKFNLKNGLPSKLIGAINHYKDNIYFIGTADKGLCTAEIDEKNLTCKFSQLNINLNNDKTRIDDIEIDNNHNFWIASSKGLYFSTDGKIFNHKKLFLNDSNQVFVQKVLCAKDGKIYVGTKSHGLFILDKGKIENLFNNSILTLGITSLTEDSYGQIWIASQYKGIVNISSKEKKWITDKNGLASNLIYILQADNNGNIWVGTNLGLDKINISDYIKTKKISIRHYDINDGLPDLEMNLNGSFEDKDNNLWFATNNGLLKYDFRYDITNRVPPIISLLSVKLHSENVDWKKYCDSLTQWNKIPINPILPHDQNHITFDFIGISYKNPKQIMYSWKLEGFDKKWVPSNKNRQVIYSNLPPGNYVFKLKSSNNDGVWNTKILKFPFVILPPFWTEWWFITISIIFVVLTFSFFIRLRFKNLKNRQVELEKIVVDRTAEIFKQKEELKAQRDTVIEQKQKIEEIHFRLSDSIDYAKRIQNSILSSKQFLFKNFLDSFVIFKPKDKVSGDFYWWTKINNLTIIAVADCTGHGVPGAFMSMLGISYLREIVENEKITEPGLILDLLRKNVIESLNQKGDYNEPKDGMDISIISIDNKNNTVKYAGANNPIYIVKSEKINIKNEYIKTYENKKISNLILYEVKSDKMPISIYVKMDNFKTKEIKLNKGDFIYLFSDGFADQFGGEKHKKIGYKSFKNIILENSSKAMAEQEKNINLIFEKWRGNAEQIDDVVIVGLRI